MKHDFKHLDKLEYTGVELSPGIYTFIETSKGVVPDDVVRVQRGDNLYDVLTSLFKFVRHGAPIYKRDTKVKFVHRDQVLEGWIRAVIPSYTNEPNEYEVEVTQGELFYPPLTKREDYIFPLGVPSTDSSATTLKHINRVSALLNDVAIMLIKRAQHHDNSKLVSPEKDILDIMEYINQNEGNAPYGSEEYARRSRFLKPFLDHHYAFNDHHPEHFPNYLYSMNLMQITEMAMDWIAAAERGGETVVNLTHSCERFCISDQVKAIIANTYAGMGVKWK